MTVMANCPSKEQEIAEQLTQICDKLGIKVLIDPTVYQIQSLAAVDVEHDEAGNLVGIGIYDGQQSLYFTKVESRLSSVLCSLQLVAHNGKGDFESLRQWGIPVSNSQLIWDTELVGHILDSSRRGYGLKKLALADLGIEYPDYQDIVGKRTAKIRRTLDRWPIEIVSKYNGLDCYCTYKLYEYQMKQSGYPKVNEVWEMEKAVSWIFQEMENRGIRIDLPYLRELKLRLEEQMRPVEAQIKNELGNINLNSPKQLLEALHAKGIKPIFKGKSSTDKRALDSLRSLPIVQQLLQYSEIETLLSSFVSPYLARGTEVVRPFFNQCGTRTGRPSCSNPNLLQIPKKTENGKLVRRMFIAREGMLLGDCDYGQIEPRVLAHLSKDPVMCEMFNSGIDFHTFTSERLCISRDKAKVLNLSVGYRATKYSVQRQLGGTLEEAQIEIDKWWALFPTLRRWQENLIYTSKKSGFCTTLLGRRIKVDGLEGYSWKNEAAERQLINNIAQGSAAEIMKLGMLKVSQDKRLHPQFGILIQVYDQLVCESPDMLKDIKIVESDMVNCIKLDVPLTVEAKIGPNWADVK